MDYMHFEAIEIDALHELYGRVLQSSPSGKLDQAAFESIFVPPLSPRASKLRAWERCGAAVCVQQLLFLNRAP